MQSASMKDQRGFVLTDIVSIVLIVGILVNVWLPSYISIKKKAQAARIVGDFLVIRDGATMFYSDKGEWPRSGEWGQTPEGLAHYLPAGFSWDLKPEMDVRYAWEHLWTSDCQGGRGGFAGVSVFSGDNALLKALLNVYGGRMVFARGFGDTRRVILMVQAAARRSND